MIQVTDWVKINKLGKYRISGSEVELGCPFESCANQGEPQFYINMNTGAWMCHRCDNKGANIKRLELALGMVVFKEPVKTSHVYIPEKDITSWTEDLMAQNEALSYLRDQRGLEDWVISQFNLGFKMYQDQPVIVIPYFDSTGTCVGAKYDFYKRAGDNKYIKEKGTKTQFYNLNNIDFTQPLVVTEGEYDTMSGFQYGFENIGSVPNGAKAVNGWCDELADANKFILCFDNDAAGSEGADKFGEYVGLSKCSRAYPKVKDLSDALQMGIDKKEVMSWFKGAEPMFTAGNTSVDQYVDELKEIQADPIKYYGEPMAYKPLNDTLKGWRSGEITAVLADSNNGKTTFSLDCVGDRFKAQNNCLIISGEMSGPEVLEKLSNNFFQCASSPEQIRMFADKAKDKIFCPNIDNWESDKEQLSVEGLFNQILYHVEQKDVKFIVLDHLELFVHEGPDMKKDMKFFMNKCRQIVRKKQVHILLLVQPTKLPDGQRRPVLNNIYGSSYVRKAIWNGIVMWREDSKQIVGFSVEKNRRFGTCGEFHLKFNTKSMCNYYENTA